MIKGTSQPGGSVKTLTDLKLEGFEKRLAELEKTNQELREANAELYAFAQAHITGQSQTVQTVTAEPAVSVQYASAQPIPQDQSAQEQAKAREDALFSGVMAEMNKNKMTAKTQNENGGM